MVNLDDRKHLDQIAATLKRLSKDVLSAKTTLLLSAESCRERLLIIIDDLHDNVEQPLKQLADYLTHSGPASAG